MAKDNVTGKDKEFYDLGKKMFDRIKPVTPTKAPPKDEVTALKEYIAHLESALDSSIALNKAQANRVCVGLTQEELSDLYNLNYDDYVSDNIGIVDFLMIAGAVESKLQEKNAHTIKEQKGEES